jgi:hypothetical protein
VDRLICFVASLLILCTALLKSDYVPAGGYAPAKPWLIGSTFTTTGLGLRNLGLLNIVMIALGTLMFLPYAWLMGSKLKRLVL